MKKKCWATICYTEHLTRDGAKAILENIGDMKGFISPVHDDDGVKPHFHVMLMFERSVARLTVEPIFLKLKGAGAEPISNPIAYARYLCHLDNADKKQYDTNSVLSLAMDYDEMIAQGVSEEQIFFEVSNKILRGELQTRAELLANRSYAGVYMRRAYAINSIFKIMGE